MNKSNVFCTTQFYLGIDDVLNVLIEDESGTPPTIHLYNITDTDTPEAGTPLEVIATTATDVLTTSFTANWEESTLAEGYYLYVATDIAFTSIVTGYNKLDVGNNLAVPVTGLGGNPTYYYRLIAYNNDLESDYSNIITVSMGNILTVTAVSKTKVYGAALPALTITYSGFVDGDDENDLDVKPIASTSVTISSLAGVYTGAITASGGVDSKYSFYYVAGNFTVTQKPLGLTLIPISKKYDGNTTAETYAYITDLSELVGTDVVTVSTSGGVFNTSTMESNKTVTASVILAGVNSANYSYTSPLTSTEGVICNARIYINADSKSYNGNHNVIITFAWAEPSDLIYGSDVTIGASTGRFIDKYVGNGKPVWAQVSCIGGTSCPNYTWPRYAKTTANIT
jgi:hypothetical protein